MLLIQHHQKQQSRTIRVVVVVFRIKSSADRTLDPVSTHLSLFRALLSAGFRLSLSRESFCVHNLQQEEAITVATPRPHRLLLARQRAEFDGESR